MSSKKSKPLSMAAAGEVRAALGKIADKKQSEILSRFFKTGKGEYGEGDIFLGVKVPLQRDIARRALSLPLEETALLLDDPAHECRLTGALILVEQYRRADEAGRERIYRFYVKHLRGINNWDLVDLSAPKIMGAHLLERTSERKILHKLARSKVLWERRVAVLATYAFIRQGDFADMFALAEALMSDTHDLMHKAVGWMLREIGKMDMAAEERFLKKHHRAMPRTMLRYAIEKFPEAKRAHYMAKG
ncbi:MAG TPA: DNA alkylation repair protein [Spirochaetota bacterium]|nr:DNA alkylation repair protein [Spirochaetota bacterium]